MRHAQSRYEPSRLCINSRRSMKFLGEVHICCEILQVAPQCSRVSLACHSMANVAFSLCQCPFDVDIVDIRAQSMPQML